MDRIDNDREPAAIRRNGDRGVVILDEEDDEGIIETIDRPGARHDPAHHRGSGTIHSSASECWWIK
ncbi:MAG: hypothetical protein N838_31785 [Thiohalocapsa sp. PB-PSB1]|nr:MAG: hypothetical protein N838_09360 [Thiohalocapsa sp. PB-PSB1]QQO57254.1 MAG: hypothetical protein N838_31785 [Thiohalocapsa sp. PB-PSB1]